MSANPNKAPNPAQPTGQMDARTRNGHQRRAVLAMAKDMIQQNQSTTIATPNLATVNQITFVPKNIGLLKRFFVEVFLTLTTAAGATAALTPFGPANIFSNISFTDFQNQSRINTTGAHLIAVNTWRQGSAPLGAAQTSDTPLGYSSVINSMFAPAALAASTSYTIRMIFEVPIVFTDMDLRGAIYMATTGANTTLQVTLNQTIFAAAGADPTNAMYLWTGSAPVINSLTVNFYQNYLDQLPLAGGKVVVPETDLNAVYQLLMTNYSGFTANNPFGIPYTNLRQFLSTMLIYDNGGVLNPGTDITNIGLQAANNTFIWQMDPYLISYRTRKKINSDMPKGSYFFDHRADPINTDQFGNIQLVINASTVNAGAVFYEGVEFIAARSTVLNAASLPSG
jgi:hypothetical protein